VVGVACEDKDVADFVDFLCRYRFGCVDFVKEDEELCMEACRKELCEATPRKRSKQ
jgi:hypothetical protein